MLLLSKPFRTARGPPNLRAEPTTFSPSRYPSGRTASRALPISHCRTMHGLRRLCIVTDNSLAYTWQIISRELLRHNVLQLPNTDADRFDARDRRGSHSVLHRLAVRER